MGGDSFIRVSQQAMLKRDVGRGLLRPLQGSASYTLDSRITSFPSTG